MAVFLKSPLFRQSAFRFFSAGVCLHPWNLRWNLKITQLKEEIIFQTSIFGFNMFIFQGDVKMPPFDVLVKR